MRTVPWLLALLSCAGCDLLPIREVPAPVPDAAAGGDLAVTKVDLGCGDACKGPAPDLSMPGCMTNDDCKEGGVPSGQVCSMDHKCVPCTVDAQCASRVCDLYGMTPSGVPGVCIPQARVLYVDNSKGETCAGKDGKSLATAFCNMDDARAALPAGTVLSVQPSATPYYLKPVIGPLALHGPADPQNPAMLAGPKLDHTMSMDTVNFQAGSDATIDGFDLVPAVQVFCGGVNPALRLRRSRVVKTEMGLATSGCLLNMDRSTVEQTTAGGLAIFGGSYAVTNSFIFNNSVPNAGSVVSLSGGQGSFLFNTVAGNRPLGAFATALLCSGSMTSIHSSIVARNPLNSSSELTPNDCQVSNIVVDGSDDGNLGLIKVDPAFVSTVAPLNFRLQKGATANSTCCIAKVPCEKNPWDFDGTRRPQGMATLCDIGAYEVPAP